MENQDTEAIVEILGLMLVELRQLRRRVPAEALDYWYCEENQAFNKAERKLEQLKGVLEDRREEDDDGWLDAVADLF